MELIVCAAILAYAAIKITRIIQRREAPQLAEKCVNRLAKAIEGHTKSSGEEQKNDQA